MDINKIHNENCLQGLKKIPDNSIDCCITSPPYYGLRDYGTATWIGGDENCKHQRKKHGDECKTGQRNVKGGSGDGIYKEVCSMCGAIRQDEQIGLEETPKKYVAKLTELFEEVRRVLKPSGTLWLNIGDSYAGSNKGSNGSGGFSVTSKMQLGNKGSFVQPIKLKDYKAKDLIGVPWMLAFALRNSGWYLRMDIIWNKPNPMPESVKDRPTKAHEYIFLMTKSLECSEHDKRSRQGRKRFPTELVNGIRGNTPDKVYEWANKRSVWTVTTKPYSEAHFATFPEDLIVDCIKAGCPENGIVLDPFMGSGTTAVVARKLNRNYVGFELNPEYIKIYEKRLYDAIGMFI